MIKGVLFDMDGVLLDSEELTAQAATQFFREKGYIVKEEDFYPFCGTGEKGFFGGVAKLYDIPYDNDIDAEKIYLLYKEIAKGKISPLPGVKDFIKICRDKGLKIAVATSAGSLKMKINLDLIGFDMNTFDVYVSGNDITNNKPNPEIFLTAAKKLNLYPKECLVVEDAPSGIEAAKNAGCKCLALLTTFKEDELKRADQIIKDLSVYPKDIFK
jgi:HAD superfamily hydrolase (TIGR01509 family)